MRSQYSVFSVSYLFHPVQQFGSTKYCIKLNNGANKVQGFQFQTIELVKVTEVESSEVSQSGSQVHV